ncbi:DUF2567 domain-containing protein [Mycolicibacterium sp. XJ1819]
MNDPAPPRVSCRRAALTVVVAMTVTGAAIGALWAVVAPSIHGVVALTKGGDRIRAYLGNEADNFFVAAFLIVGMLCAMSVIAAVLVWQWRAHRGPLMAATLSVGAAAAAGAATGVGALLVHWRYGAIDVDAAPVTPEQRVHYVVEAPAVFFGASPLQAAMTILFPVAVAALVYSLLVLSTPRDDLGAWPPVERPALDPSVTAGSALPSAR